MQYYASSRKEAASPRCRRSLHYFEYKIDSLTLGAVLILM